MKGGNNLENLKDVRKKSGLKVQKIAEDLGVSRKTYYNKENGYSSFEVEDLIILSKLFNLEITELVQVIRGSKVGRIDKIRN